MVKEHLKVAAVSLSLNILVQHLDSLGISLVQLSESPSDFLPLAFTHYPDHRLNLPCAYMVLVLTKTCFCSSMCLKALEEISGKEERGII